MSQEHGAVDFVAHPLVVGEGQDQIAYARFRLHQIGEHVKQHRPPLDHRFWQEARTETYSLIHTLRLYGAIKPEDEWQFLKNVEHG